MDPTRRLSALALAVVVLASLASVSLASGGVGAGAGPNPRPSKSPKDRCDDRDQGHGNDKKCPSPSPTEPSPSTSPSESPPLTTAASVGFGTRKITPVGTPPEEWAQFFTPHPTTGVWGEPFLDLDTDGCYDGVVDHRWIEDWQRNGPDPSTDPRQEPHVDQPWNSTGNAFDRGAFSVDGVTIYGDPQSAGKWDGLWANAGFGSRCTLGMHDDTWARAIVMQVGDHKVALVSIDVVGFFNIEIERARRELNARYPDLDVDELVVSSTHTHEGVDTMGFWGQTLGIDGKFPAYNAFIRSQIIDAVNEANERLEPAFAKFGVTELTMGIRDSRPPQVIDPYLLAAQFIAEDDGATLGTVVNWSNHPEAQGSNNPLVSSDFPHGARETLETDLGGTAIYFSGSVGGLMTPLRVDIPGYGSEASWERTFEIGRLVAVAAEEALAAAPVVGIDDLASERREFYMQADNTALHALNGVGVFDIPTYHGADSWGQGDHTEGVYSGSAAGEQFKTEMVAVRFGPALFLTVPGELFPEIELGGYGRPDCPAADTGRPYEPVINDQFDHQYQFVLGLAQDELGYIVPGYDFWLRHVDDGADGNDGNPNGVFPIGAFEEEDPCGESHYEETVSASSVMAPWVGCVAAELGDAVPNPWASEPACSRENTHSDFFGADPSEAGQQQSQSHLGGFEHPPGYYSHTHEHPHDH